MLSNNINGCYLSNDSSYIRFPYGEVNIIFHCMRLLIQVAYMFIQWFCASLSPPHTLTYMCFDNFDTVGSMRGHLCCVSCVQLLLGLVLDTVGQ